MTSSEVLVATTIAYFVWATVVLDSHFHRVWSLALGSLEFSVLVLPREWPSWSAYFLIFLTVIDVVFCVALSPLQRFIVPVSPRYPAFPSIEEVPPLKTDDVNQEHVPVLAESV